jgi:PadR family transcriptional regulator PadR
MARYNAAKPSSDSWEAQLRKGSLEMAILASLWKSEHYGLEILHALDGRSSLALAEGTLYLILNRLKNDGFVESKWVDAGTGHPRKYYWLTEEGRERLRAMARFWIQFSADLNVLLEPVIARKERINASR